MEHVKQTSFQLVCLNTYFSFFLRIQWAGVKMHGKYTSEADVDIIKGSLKQPGGCVNVQAVLHSVF